LDFISGAQLLIRRYRTLHTTSRRRLANTIRPLYEERLMVTQFDERKGVTWHCIVGRNFGSFVTHGRVALNTVDMIGR
jgi:hypothetical protein